MLVLGHPCGDRLWVVERDTFPAKPLHSPAEAGDDAQGTHMLVVGIDHRIFARRHLADTGDDVAEELEGIEGACERTGGVKQH